MFIASFASHAHPDFANAQSNNRTSMQPQGVQSTQGVQNTTANNYTGLEEKNKALVLKAFDTLFNQRDYVAAERYWSPNYIQHSAHIEPGREGLFNLVKSSPPTLKYEPGTIVADGDFVIVHGKFSGRGQPVNWIAADILYIKDGVMVEHWDVIQDEATQEQSKSGLPMFGDKFPNTLGKTNK
jgi:predicted SnoaL-like aldol condensation-catalyzing enzyme